MLKENWVAKHGGSVWQKRAHVASGCANEVGGEESETSLDEEHIRPRELIFGLCSPWEPKNENKNSRLGKPFVLHTRRDSVERQALTETVQTQKPDTTTK